MDKIIIEPGHGVGVLKLGLTKNNVNECIQTFIQQYNDHENRHFENYVIPGYNENEKMIAVQVVRDLMKYANFECHGIDVFNTKAEKLVKYMDKISPYLRNWESAAGGHYVFPDIGLALYRSNAITEEDLKEEWFLAQSLENQEYDMKYLFFESIMVCGLNYYDFLRIGE
ncbi:hypothetical protein ABU162_25395 [Paenibacillus thiaminolyticus]|uniref:hypothetical protein n=1 Tax=Paenibacillus thiaminolyticus TaxID=49283 RepID=UPI0035A69AE0